VVALQPTTQAQGASGEVLVAPDGMVAVAIHGLAAPGSGTYTMWLTDDGQTRSLGDFRPDASGEVRMATAGTVGHRPKLVVTLENRPGRTSPGGPSVFSA
jgi:anti-sigma-K factor RskA